MRVNCRRWERSTSSPRFVLVSVPFFSFLFFFKAEFGAHFPHRFGHTRPLLLLWLFLLLMLLMLLMLSVGVGGNRRRTGRRALFRIFFLNSFSNFLITSTESLMMRKRERGRRRISQADRVRLDDDWPMTNASWQPPTTNPGNLQHVEGKTLIQGFLPSKT